MAREQGGPNLEAPLENFQGGIYEINLPQEYGEKESGKVRDTWVIDGLRFEVTTDRLSAFNHRVCTVPGRGQLLVAFTQFWADETSGVIQNDIIASPHPNILVRQHMQDRIPAEVILRDYMAESSTETSVFRQYMDYGRRNIYGIDFPEGLGANEKFPMGTIITPTTKTSDDEEMDDDTTRHFVDGQLGDGVWDATKDKALKVFKKGKSIYESFGIIPADTKLEFALHEGEVVLIDEILTPDSSRLWLSGSYGTRFAQGLSPINFDKEIIRREMARLGYKKGEPIPKIDTILKSRTLEAYQEPYQMVTGKSLPIQDTDQDSVTQALIGAIHLYAPSFQGK